MISMMAVLDAMVIAMQQNLENYSRDEAVRIAEQEMNTLRNTDFATLPTTIVSPRAVTRLYKQRTRTFTITTDPPHLLSANSYSIHLEVSWTINGRPKTHSITSIISRGA